jgi:hypothetical protein
MKKLFSLAVVVMLFSALAFADIRRPDDSKSKPSKAIDATLSISIDGTATEARLIIPRSQLRQLRAELDQLDGADDTAASAGNFTRTQTIVSGLFLSLAFVFGGVWFARSGKLASPQAKAMVIAVGLFASGAFATFVYANAGPPTDARSITGKIFTPSVHMYKQAWGNIKLEVSDESRSVRLIVPDVPKPASE